MKSFEVEGVVYRSISEFCRKRKVSYWKMRRLYRTYVRAHKDPAVAARWLLGLEPFKITQEPLTSYAIKENELSKLRMITHRAKRFAVGRKKLIKNLL